MAVAATSARPDTDRDVLAAIFRCGAAYADRLPMLPVALERVAAAFTEELGAVSTARLEVTYLGLDSGLVADLLAPNNEDSLPGLLHAGAWDAHLLVNLGRDLVCAYIDFVFGGDGSQPDHSDARPVSRIEYRIAQTLIGRLAGALAMGFQPFAATPFAVDGEAGRINADRLGGSHAPVAIARYRLAVGQLSGELRLAIPDAVLTALKPAFARPPPGTTGTADPGWAQSIHGEINRTRLAMRAVLDERLRPLAEIAALRVGQVLPLEATARSPVRMDCNGEPLLWCELSQSNGAYSLRVHAFVDREQEFMNGILSG